MIIVNFKTYNIDTLKLAKALDSVADDKVMIAVQATDIYKLKIKVNTPILAQHVDPGEQGRNTGHVLPEAVKNAGAIGTLLNHAEHRLSFNALTQTINRCKSIGLKTIVCVPSVESAREVMNLKPDYMAYEDPQLIASGKSISTVKPDQVKLFAELLKDTGIIPLCGAGITTSDDVKKALDLGTQGILVASAITKSDKPEQVLKSYLEVI